jgi:hypothetical protein
MADTRDPTDHFRRLTSTKNGCLAPELSGHSRLPAASPGWLSSTTGCLALNAVGSLSIPNRISGSVRRRRRRRFGPFSGLSGCAAVVRRVLSGRWGPALATPPHLLPTSLPARRRRAGR